MGGLRPQEAAAQITAGLVYPTRGKILLRDGERIWVAAPAQLGLYLDAKTSASRAYAIGRQGWLLGRIQAQFLAWYSGETVSPNMVFDQRAAYAYLSTLSKEIDEPTVEASLELKGTDVVVLPGRFGRSLDINQSLAQVSLQLQSMRDGVIDLPITESSPIILDASKQAELARAILKQPLTLALPPKDRAPAHGS